MTENYARLLWLKHVASLEFNIPERMKGNLLYLILLLDTDSCYEDGDDVAGISLSEKRRHSSRFSLTLS